VRQYYSRYCNDPESKDWPVPAVRALGLNAPMAVTRLGVGLVPGFHNPLWTGSVDTPYGQSILF
jgi:hypothetical protein